MTRLSLFKYLTLWAVFIAGAAVAQAEVPEWPVPALSKIENSSQTLRPEKTAKTAVEVFVGEVSDPCVGQGKCYWSPRKFEGDIMRKILASGTAP